MPTYHACNTNTGQLGKTFPCLISGAPQTFGFGEIREHPFIAMSECCRSHTGCDKKAQNLYDFDCFQELQRKMAVGGTVGFQGLAVGLKVEREQKTTMQSADLTKLTEEGFTCVPSQAVTTFQPACRGTDTVFITVTYFDAGGNELYAAHNHPHNKSQAVIVTATGGIVDAKSEYASWIDRNGIDHKRDPCPDCQELSSLCPVCLVDSKMEKIQNSIRAVQSCRVAQNLVSTIAKIEKEKLAKKGKESRKLMEEVENLAKYYWILEAKTKRTVRDVRAYGSHLKEAAVDFLQDGILGDFLEQMLDMEDVKASLKEANEEHEVIKGKVKMVEEKARGVVEVFVKKSQKAFKHKDHLDDLEDLTFASIPFLGQVGCGVVGAIAFAEEAAQACHNSEHFDNFPSKVIAGGVAGAVGLGAGLVVSVLTVPAGPIIWCKAVSSAIKGSLSDDYDNLQEQFSSIALQMGLIETHLGHITEALGDIETCLNSTRKAQKQMIKKKHDEKWVSKVIERAAHLIAACDEYSTIVTNSATLTRASSFED